MNLANKKFWYEGLSYLRKNEEFVEKIKFNKFRFKDVWEINLAKTDFIYKRLLT